MVIECGGEAVVTFPEIHGRSAHGSFCPEARWAKEFARKGGENAISCMVRSVKLLKNSDVFADTDTPFGLAFLNADFIFHLLSGN